MRIGNLSRVLLLGSGVILGVGSLSTVSNGAKPAKAAKAAEPLSAAGQKLEAEYSSKFNALKAEIAKALPSVSEQKKSELQRASDAVQKAEAAATATQNDAGAVGRAKALIDHAKGKWIGGAEKGIAAAEAALKKATTDAEREAAKKDLANWQANKEDGLKALKERQAIYDKAKLEESNSRSANESTQAALAKAKEDEMKAFNAVLADLAPVLSSDKFDTKLVPCVVMAEATPRGLAEFAAQGSNEEKLVDVLLADGELMEEMLYAGGANFGKYGQAMKIYTAIQKASPKASTANLKRLAIATALEHAQPIAQSSAANKTDGPATVDPVKRYLHYEKAFLDGELDPAFKSLTTWEYRMVVGCDAPDEILSWGRQMLRNYRPDHIYSPNYGWRYVSAVKTEVPYGSQNVKDDLPSLHNYQNIIKDGGVCGRRAFFGRFILRCFGIPTWGVTQHAHAALSHWTPTGWVVNLGAGYNFSWWDRDDVSLSGNQFLTESQAREHADDYIKVLRAQWVSRVLGEDAYNDRKKVVGGFWSRIGHFQSVVLASKAVALGPLGQELGEANESDDKKAGVSDKVSADEQKVVVKDGVITIPAVAHGQASGKASAMKSYLGGMQMHCFGGFKAQYEFDAPKAGSYVLTAKVATVQEGQKFIFALAGKGPSEVAVPYTIGMWQQTPPVEVTLAQGKNVLSFESKQGSRGVTVKEFSLKAK